MSLLLSETADIVGGRPVTVGGITVETVALELSAYAILLSLRLRSANENPTDCDISVFAETNVGGNEVPHVAVLPGGNGLYWSGEYLAAGYRLNVVSGNDCPLTLPPISSYWFGPFYELLANRWNQTTESFYSGDVGVAWSWQGISVPALGSAIRSVLLRSGNHYTDKPTLSILGGSEPPRVPIGGSFTIIFLVTDPIATSVLKIFVVYAGDVSDATLVIGQVNQNVPVPVAVTLPAEYVTVGDGRLMFFAVNDIGFISDEVILPVTVDPAADATLTRSPSPSFALSSPTPVVFVPPAEESSTAGKIAGGVVGGFLGLLVVAAIVLYLLHRCWKSGAEEKVAMDYTIDSEFKEESLEEAMVDLDPDDLDIYFSQNANFGVDLPFSARFDEAEQEAFVHLYQNF
jgi:hypothetical protein